MNTRMMFARAVAGVQNEAVRNGCRPASDWMERWLVWCFIRKYARNMIVDVTL